MGPELGQLSLNLAVATIMVAATTLVHFVGLGLLIGVMGRAHTRLATLAARLWQAGMLLIVVFGVFAVHTIEIWLYAVLYRGLGELQTFEEALYFSTVTFASLGYGDIVLSPQWRVLSAIEAANGVILVAWSTAFLFSVTTRLRILEHDWLERT
jgi:hypothetical protein